MRNEPRNEQRLELALDELTRIVGKPSLTSMF